jgi:hypothetical protein
MTREEFKDHWLNFHGPHFMQVAKDYRVKKYVQSHTLDTRLNAMMRNIRGMNKEYDGIAEIWWESEADYIAGLNSSEMQKRGAEFLAAEADFVDPDNSTAFFTIEHALL